VAVPQSADMSNHHHSRASSQREESSSDMVGLQVDCVSDTDAPASRLDDAADATTHTTDPDPFTPPEVYALDTTPQLFELMMHPVVVDALTRSRSLLHDTMCSLSAAPVTPAVTGVRVDMQSGLVALQRAGILTSFRVSIEDATRLWTLAALSSTQAPHPSPDASTGVVDAATGASLGEEGMEELLCRVAMHAWVTEGLPGCCPADIVARGVEAAVQCLAQFVKSARDM